MVRRLPVVQNAASSGPASRSVAYRVGAGALLTVACWVPLALLLAPIGARVAARAVGVAPEDVASGAVRWSGHDAARFATLAALPILTAFGIAAFGSGFAFARFGGSGRRDGAAAALLAGFVLVGVAKASRSGPSWTEAIVALPAVSLVGVGCGILGALLGQPRKGGGRDP